MHPQRRTRLFVDAEHLDIAQSQQQLTDERRGRTSQGSSKIVGCLGGADSGGSHAFRREPYPAHPDLKREAPVQFIVDNYLLKSMDTTSIDLDVVGCGGNVDEVVVPMVITTYGDGGSWTNQMGLVWFDADGTPAPGVVLVDGELRLWRHAGGTLGYLLDLDAVASAALRGSDASSGADAPAVRDAPGGPSGSEITADGTRPEAGERTGGEARPASGERTGAVRGGGRGR